jgi:hypothetical protein
MRKIVGAGVAAEIFDKLEPEPDKNRPALQHWLISEDTKLGRRKSRETVS